MGELQSLWLPTTDKTSLDVCSSAGMNLITQRHAKFQDLRRGLHESVRSMDRAKNTQDKLSRLLLAANLIKATCDAFIEMGAEMGDAAGLKQAKLVGASYAGIAATAEATSQTIHGQKADWMGVGTKVAKAATEKVMGSKVNAFGKVVPGSTLETAKKLAEVEKGAMELGIIKVEIVNKAVKNDNAGVLKAIFLGYIPKLASITLKQMGADVTNKFIKVGVAVAKSGAAYSDALDKAFNTRLSDMDDTNALESQVRDLRKQLLLIDVQIKNMENMVAYCAGQSRRS